MSKPTYSIHLKGYVGGADFDRNYVDYVLSRNEDKPVTVLIDSLGGSVATALSIASAFSRHGDVSVHFVGMNASAATIASLGARHISIDRSAMYLVHKCSQAFFEWGSLNADQFATLISECTKVKEDLDKLDSNIASMYAAKCRKEPKDLLALMARGGWLTSEEALDWGFVDEITDAEEDSAPTLTSAVAEELVAAGIPLPDVPLSEQTSALERFRSAILSLFRITKTDTAMTTNNTQQQTTDEPMARIAELEASLSERDATIASLQAEVAALKAAPAATSTQVVDEGNPATDTTADPLADYFRRVAEAKSMFNALP